MSEVGERNVRQNASAGRSNTGRIWATIVIVVVAACCGLFLYFTYLPAENGLFNILILGEDRNYSRNGDVLSAPGRPDTILLLMVPKSSRGAALLSIPRDTLVRFPNGGVRRINSSVPEGGVDLARELVSDLVGLPVHRHVVVDFGGFVELVDALGGVEVAVDKRMKYEDKAGGYSIDLEPGVYHMDGEMALSFVRYRQDGLGDISRTARQQEFVKAFIREAGSFRAIPSYPNMLRVAQKCADTDMTVKEVAAVAWRLRRLDSDTINSATLPGYFKGAYWDPDTQGIEALVRSLQDSAQK
ncbi:MAG: LCP family protein [Bacillota bacterium]|jgi:LCP family protein required for cell wall assembly|nr:LCP family protein [Bacillota bacterium]HOB41629.1 LCP family protein [Bacillota bacterium]HOL52302.1 LCP family protein [Bacillota bacterium]HPQ01752.1 LCP family protein [Bacillota bacterium]HQD79267.1 LCP family protein [Bacillota bacterium]